MPSQASLQAPGEPGIAKMKVEPRRGARLDRRRADLVVADAMEHSREAVHTLLEQRLDRLGRDVPAGEASAPRGDDDVDLRIADPAGDDGADLVDIVGDDRPLGKGVAGGFDPVGERLAGLVVLKRARVRYGKHGETDRNERKAWVGLGHGPDPRARCWGTEISLGEGGGKR